MSNETIQPNMSKSLKHEIGDILCDYYNERLIEKPTINDREELQFKYAGEIIDQINSKENVVTERPLIPFNIREIKLLIDQLQRFEGIMGKYNCQHGGLECNFQTNYHRLLRAEIDKLELSKEKR